MNSHANQIAGLTNDERFILEFEAGTLAPEGFHHGEHVRVVWFYLRRYSLIETLSRFSRHLKMFAAAQGQAQKYHETITWAYVLLINQRVALDPQLNWTEFRDANPDLFDWKDNILKLYYSEEVLRSELAR